MKITITKEHIDIVCEVNRKQLLEAHFGQKGTDSLTEQLRQQLYQQYGIVANGR